MKTMIGLVGAALLCFGMAAATADDATQTADARIVVSDLGDHTLLMAARDERDTASIETVKPQQAKPARTVRMVGPKFFGNE